MAGDGKTDFYAEIGLKLNEAQAKKEAAKGAKIASDAMKKALTKSVEETERRQASANVSLPKGFSFSSKAFMKERDEWIEILNKNEKEEINKEKANEKRLEKRLKEDEAERKRINRKEESDRKAKEKAENVAQREKERRQKQEERLKEKAYRKDIARIKSLSKWALGTTIAGGYIAQRVMSQSAERAFSFRNVQDIGVDYKTLRKWQAASKVFGNIKEEESAQSLVNLRNYRARMAQFGEASSLHANKLSGIDWSQKDERKLVNDISSAILRQNKDIQGVLTEEVFGSQKYLSVLKRFQENPQEVLDVEKNILGGSLTDQQIKDIDELGQSFRIMSLNASNLKDKLTATIALPVKDFLDSFNSGLKNIIDQTKGLNKEENKKQFKEWFETKETSFDKSIKELNPFTWLFKWGMEADYFRKKNPEKWWGLQNDAELERKARLETAMLGGNKDFNKMMQENNKNITVNVGGVTVNKPDSTNKVMKDIVGGALNGSGVTQTDINNLYMESTTMSAR